MLGADSTAGMNHPQCGSGPPEWLDAMRHRAEGDERKMMQVDGLATCFDRDKRRYAHFVDGSITDNPGLRALVDIVEAVGGPETYLKAIGREAPRDQVLIVVNASTEPEPQMDASNRQPSAGATISALTDIQLHCYNIDTIELTKARLRE
jgi:NTE family protein